MTRSILESALHYRSNGISVIPINPRTKRPYFKFLPKTEKGDPTWKPYQSEIADEATIRQWFEDTDAAVGCVCGAVSGGLLIIDTDVPRFYDVWRANVGELADGLPAQTTGGGGNQTLMRCSDPGQNRPLAWAPNEAEDTGREIAMETRAEGGYAVLAPSFHPSGNRYVSLVDDLAAIPTISQARADALLAAARKLDEAPKTRQGIEAAAKVETTQRAAMNGQASVIGAYNQAVTITDLLETHKYTKHGDGYARPDGSHQSVTIDEGKSFHHNTNDPLSNGYWRDAFGVYCQMNHAGDVKKAVKAAAEQLGMKMESHDTKATKKTSGQDETAGRRYLTEDEIDTLRPPTWLIKGVMPAGEVTLVSGPGDAGKTFIVTDMMKRVAQHYPVMYGALEDAPGIRIRKRAWELHYQRPKNGNFLMWTQALDLYDAVSVDSFIAEVAPLGLRMITLDTLSRALGGADENSNTDIAVVMNNCERIAHATGAAVVILHHTTKDGQAYRGASALKNNTYGHLEISRDDDLIHFKIGRIKNTAEQAPRYFKLVSVPLPDILDDDGNPVSSAVILPADRVPTGDRITANQVRMLETLMLMDDAQGGASTTELAKATGLVGNSFYSALKRLKALGLMTKGDNTRDPLTITSTGRARLSVESANPEHQLIGITIDAAPPFEVNTRLDALLPLLPGSNELLPNDPGSNDGSNEPETDPENTIATNITTSDIARPQAITTITTKLLPDDFGSNELLLPTYHTPLGVVVGSNRGSNGLEHDLRREAEVAKALAAGDVKAARAAANQIRGRKEQKAADLKIAEYVAAHKTEEASGDLNKPSSRYSGDAATIIGHDAVMGRWEKPVRQWTVGDVAPYAQYPVSVFMTFIEPGKRKRAAFTVYGDLRYLTVEAGGDVLYDSRWDVPCDMDKWATTNAKFTKNRGITIHREQAV